MTEHEETVNYGEGLTCEHVGHSWHDAGGGLEICALCEAEQWADKDERGDLRAALSDACAELFFAGRALDNVGSIQHGEIADQASRAARDVLEATKREGES